LAQLGDQDQGKDAGLPAGDEARGSALLPSDDSGLTAVTPAELGTRDTESGPVGEQAAIAPQLPVAAEGPERRRPRVSLILPAYNEEARLGGSCSALRQLLAGQGWTKEDLEVIIVDDGSTDHTAETAQSAVRSYPRMRLLQLPWHAGKGAAVRLGVGAAQGDAIVFMDADLATDLRCLPEGLRALRDADVVIGSRAAPGAVVTGRSWIRTLLHRVFGSNARRLTGVPASDPQCGFKLFRSEAAKTLFPISRVDGFGFDVEILLLARKVGYRVKEMPVHWHAVEGSHVHVLRDPLIMLRDLLRVRLRYGRHRTLTRKAPGDGPISTHSPGPRPPGRGCGMSAAAPRTMPSAVPAQRRGHRILFASWRDLAHPQAGGSEVLIDRLASACLDRGHDVRLMCAAPTGQHPYGVIPIGGQYTQYLRAPLAHARAAPADVLVDVENGIPFFSPLWRRGPIVCLVHHIHREQWQMRFPRPVAAVGRALEERAMPRAYRRAVFVAVSPSTAAALGELGVPSRHIRVLPMGADPTAQKGAGKSPTPLFLALGRLVPHKRLDLLLQLWERVRDQVGGRLVIAGDGPERERLLRVGAQGVEVTGRVSEEEKRRLLQSAWLLVHSAAHEGWGFVISEAGAEGTPALSFDVPGVRDSIQHGVTGFLASSEREFVEQWVALATDRPRRELLGAGARACAEARPWRATVDEFLAALDDAFRLQAGGTAA
jgi:glycosyltransferase involved in cell wall biosynthesis